MWRFATDAMFSFSTFPVRAIVLLGVLCMVVGACLLAGALLALPWRSTLGPVAALGGGVTALAGLQLGALGVIGGYVARSFEASRGRPLYLLKQAPDEHGEPRLIEVKRSAMGS
ncbi:MAG: hypothetical protein ABW352_12565, partial [Polyangiales bacterium]